MDTFLGLLALGFIVWVCVASTNAKNKREEAFREKTKTWTAKKLHAYAGLPADGAGMIDEKKWAYQIAKQRAFEELS